MYNNIALTEFNENIVQTTKKIYPLNKNQKIHTNTNYHKNRQKEKNETSKANT